MYKKIVLLASILIIMTGCTKVTQNLDDVVNAIMTPEEVSVNTVSQGYELYIPNGVRTISDLDYNQKFKIKDRYVYLYVDIISYYYKNNLNFKNEDSYSYFYKEINVNNKTGYIGINKLSDDNYFCEVVYNYTKMEFYTDLDNLPQILANVLIIQKSIKFNDKLISMDLEDAASEGKEIKYELDKPEDAESTFSKYLQEYVAEETEDEVAEELPDED